MENNSNQNEEDNIMQPIMEMQEIQEKDNVLENQFDILPEGGIQEKAGNTEEKKAKFFADVEKHFQSLQAAIQIPLYPIQENLL